jgi:hypothetical protein
VDGLNGCEWVVSGDWAKWGLGIGDVRWRIGRGDEVGQATHGGLNTASIVHRGGSEGVWSSYRRRGGGCSERSLGEWVMDCGSTNIF